MKIHLGKCESRMAEMNHVNQRKVINGEQLQRAGAAMQMLENMNHRWRGGASKTCVPRPEPGNERHDELPERSREVKCGGVRQRHFGPLKTRRSRGIGPHFAFLPGSNASSAISAGFAALNRVLRRSVADFR